MTEQPISYGQRLSTLAAEHPDKPALIYSPQDETETVITWREFDRRSNQIARLLARYGAGEKSRVVIGLWNSPEHYLVTYATWKLGGQVLPLRAEMPGIERDKILELAAPALVISEWTDTAYPHLRPADLVEAQSLSDAALPDRIPNPGYALGSGGSTGRPKIIVTPGPMVATEEGLAYAALLHAVGVRPRQKQLVCGPLYHNGPFLFSHIGLFLDHTLIVMGRFDAARAVDLIERHRIEYMLLVPTMMQRIIRLPGIEKRDLSSLTGVMHTAAPCPPWLKRAWIDLIGGERLYEGYGASEGPGNTAIRGDEWLKHPGSIGLPVATELRILDENGQDLPPGEVGEIFMRRIGAAGPSYEYVGSNPAKSTPDGFMSVGDLGWLDGEGYLYLADRRVDMIISGGVNIFPAEVEAALSEHEAVGDVAVIGIPDPEWGRRIHAIIQPRDPANPVTIQELDRHCRERLTTYKVPKSYEFMEQLPRSSAGKIRRSELMAEREQAGSFDIQWVRQST